MAEKLALLGGTPVRQEPFPGWAVFDETERNALIDVLESGQWNVGEKVTEFEQKYAAYQTAKYGIACTSGTTALEIAMIAAGIGAGDEVIVSPYTFMASVSSILRVNALPVFCDVELETYNLDPEKIEPLLTDKTKALMPVHFSGLICDMDRINAIADQHGLKVIEDAAHCWGSFWKGKGAGALGDAGGFSFQMSKNITAGEGGIVLTDDQELAARATAFGNCGRGFDDPWFGRFLMGTNLRMTAWQAAVLLVQLGRLQEQVEVRERNGRYLDRQLAGIEGIRQIREDDRQTQRSYHLYQYRYVQEEFGGLPREKFFEAAKAEGIDTYGGYPQPLHKMPLFQRAGTGREFCPLSCPFHGKEVDYREQSFPVAEEVCRVAGWMRQSILLGTREDMDDIVEAFRKVRDNVDQLL